MWWSVNWLHIWHDKCTWRNRPESRHSPVMKDQWDCGLNDLEELGGKEFLVLMNQYNTDFFSCFLLLLPLYSSTFHQTNVESSQNRSEDNPLISRIQSLHLLLEVNDHDEEECSVVLTLGKRWTNNLLAQYQSKFFPRWVQFLLMSRQEYVFVVFASAFDRLANANTSIFVSEVSCSLSSYSLSIKSVTNLFKPWEIMTHEWELSLCTDSILIATPYLPCRQLVVTSNTGPILVFPRIQPFGFLAKCTHDKPLTL